MEGKDNKRKAKSAEKAASKKQIAGLNVLNDHINDPFVSNGDASTVASPVPRIPKEYPKRSNAEQAKATKAQQNLIKFFENYSGKPNDISITL